MKVRCVTNRPAFKPSRARRLSASIEPVGPFLLQLAFPNGKKQDLYFQITDEYRDFLYEALKASGLENRAIRLANGLLAIMREAPIDAAATVHRLRRLIAAP